MKQVEVTEASMIKLWKKKEVDHVEMKFSCGGDSMEDTDFEVHLKNGEIETDGELVDYFDGMVYEKVQFYDNSDGHYQGEEGTVEITLEDGRFNYDKSSTAEWNENDTEDVYVNLTAKESAFVKEHVLNINGGEEEEMSFNYKHDFILTTEHEKIIEKLDNKIITELKNFRDGLDVENLNKWYAFTTNEVGDLEIKNKKLKVDLTYSYTEYRDGEGD